MVEVRLKTYRRFHENDKVYSVDTLYLYDDKADKRIEEWRNNPWFYEVLSVRKV